MGPLPDVKLTLEAPTPKGSWTMRVTNTGTIPVRLVADARLLTLDVTVRGGSKALRCELPADMRPSDDTERPLVLPPGRSYVEHFEPRLFCFGPRLFDALAQGSIVVGHLGWPNGNRAHSPYEVASIPGVEPELAPLKELISPPIGLPDESSPAMTDPIPARPEDPDPVKLDLYGVPAIDAQSSTGININVSLHNAGKRAVVTRFRPETLRFNVTGPSGVTDCRWVLNPVAPMPEFFTTIPPGGTTDLGVLLDAYCSDRVFHHPGLLVVRPELDTHAASGADIGLRTFDGRVVSTRVTVVRLHQGLKPPKLEHPQLEPLPAPPGAPVPEAPAAPSAPPAPPPTLPIRSQHRH